MDFIFQPVQNFISEKMVKREYKNIGDAIKKHRLAANMSQMALAEKIGISYQQLQKYEKGINNISVFRLQQISDALKIPVIKLIESIEPGKIEEEIPDYGLNKEEKKFLDLLRRIENKNIRRGLFLSLKGILEILEKKKI